MAADTAHMKLFTALLFLDRFCINMFYVINVPWLWFATYMMSSC